ncbi:MAG: hypothetical protein AB4372_12250 [Xenococcus sp. (in: cyanobacteria)]
MSKPLEEMIVKELRQYMFNHRNDDQKWSKALELFNEKADWKTIPTGTSPEEEKRIIDKIIAQRIKK